MKNLGLKGAIIATGLSIGTANADQSIGKCNEYYQKNRTYNQLIDTNQKALDILSEQNKVVKKVLSEEEITEENRKTLMEHLINNLNDSSEIIATQGEQYKKLKEAIKDCKESEGASGYEVIKRKIDREKANN